MADKLQTFHTYDFSKTIKDIEVSTLYITALQNIISKMIMADDKWDTVGEVFAKFEKIVEAASNPDLTEEEKDAVPKLDEWEADLYTLFSILQQLKFKAKEQGLEIQTETTATKEEVAALGRAMLAGEDVRDRIKDLESSLKVVK